MDTKNNPSYNLYKKTEQPKKFHFKNDKNFFLNSPRLKTTNSNISKYNMKIVDKKYMSKRDEILSKNKTFQSPSHFNKYNSDNRKDNIQSDNVAQTLFDFTYPHIHKKDKEGLIVDLYHVSNEMDEQNNKLEELHQEYSNLISNSLAYKIIIEKILGLDENGNSINKNNENNESNNDNKIKEKSKSDNNLKIIKKNTKKNNNKYIKKNKS